MIDKVCDGVKHVHKFFHFKEVEHNSLALSWAQEENVIEVVVWGLYDQVIEGVVISSLPSVLAAPL